MKKIVKQAAALLCAVILTLSVTAAASATPATTSEDQMVQTSAQGSRDSSRTRYLITGAIILAVGGGIYLLLNVKTKKTGAR